MHVPTSATLGHPSFMRSPVAGVLLLLLPVAACYTGTGGGTGASGV
jgi:hypothetical protein